MAGVSDPTRRARRFHGARRGQSGFTLLEAIVGMGLISTVIIALAAGLLTSIRSSDSARSTQELDAALSAFAEDLKSAPPPDCGIVSATVQGFEASTATPQSWDAANGRWSGCDDSARPMRLDITVTDTSGSNVSGQVVVGAP
ncbi:MAG: type IV pilus modification PilV family protein [Microthrixaceae bacterium]